MQEPVLKMRPYAAAGATLVDTAEEIYGTCEFVAKVKEFGAVPEYGMLREGLIVFTCIHPAAHPEEVQVLLDKKVTAFTAEDSHRYGSPNCEAAGKQGALFGLESMLTINGGKRTFVSGLGGAPGMKVLILGGGCSRTGCSFRTACTRRMVYRYGY